VAGIDANKTVYLTLDELAADPKLARRLPPDLAWRYHALPLAEDNGRITVALAHPEDAGAREAVVAALGPKSCVVRGSALAIDARLTEIWGNEARRPLKVKACAIPDPLPDELWGYAQAIGTLLGTHVDLMRTEGEVDSLVQQEEHTQCDLVIFGKRCHPLIPRLLSRSVADGALASEQGSVPFAVLVVQQPRWPIKRILLVLCGDSANSGAIDWALRLARQSTAAVTVLAIVPPVPAMYQGLSRMEQGVAGLLTTDTALGRQMHQAARLLAAGKIDGTLRLRQGAPDQQISREVVAGDHDLVVMATVPCRWWLRQLKGDPICSLLRWADRPVLLAQPTTA
jgi:nucleotide-binding universal stress UspA family protein